MQLVCRRGGGKKEQRIDFSESSGETLHSNGTMVGTKRARNGKFDRANGTQRLLRGAETREKGKKEGWLGGGGGRKRQRAQGRKPQTRLG